MFTVFGLFLCTNFLQAQDAKDEPFRYLFTPGDHRYSGFGGPLVQFGSAEGEFAVYSGGGGALLIDQRFFIGGYGMGLASRHIRENIELGGKTYDRLRTSFGHGGFWLGYVHKASNLVHLGISTRLGWGELALYDDRFDIDNYDYLTRDRIFVLHPQLEVEMNITRWFKFNVGVGYQLVSGVNGYRYSDNQEPVFVADDYSGPQATLGFLFGGFGTK